MYKLIPLNTKLTAAALSQGKAIRITAPGLTLNVLVDMVREIGGEFVVGLAIVTVEGDAEITEGEPFIKKLPDVYTVAASCIENRN